MRHRFTLAFALGLASLVSASRAAAQPVTGAQSDTYIETKSDSGSASIVFKDDAATGSTLGGTGARIIAPGAAFRMGLVRPRLNFVSEMLKSVESL